MSASYKEVGRQEGRFVCFQELRRPKWVQHSFAPEELPILQLKNIKATGNMILVWDFDVVKQEVVLWRRFSLPIPIYLSPCLPVYLSPCLLLPPSFRTSVPAFQNDLPLTSDAAGVQKCSCHPLAPRLVSVPGAASSGIPA